MSNHLGLDPDRVGSLDEHGHRKNIIPAEVRGKFRRARDWTQGILILFFLILPWIKIGGHQALLLDIPRREFAIFGLKLYAHDAPLIFFVLAILTIGLAFVTAVWGRVWCGWACPQTVFIDGVFRRIEQFVEGGYLQRRKMASTPITPQIFVKRSIKWFLFFVVSSAIAHSFAAYFVGADRITEMMMGPPSENWTYFVLVSSFTAAILFDFGWFREQFCIIMCPYGRFQGLLMDSTSMAVLYDEKRGEPRKGMTAPGQTAGDCVSCRRCVEVCPTSIDIRKGLQMECIACTACADACDEIMEKVKKPKGLIRYSNLRGGTWKLKKPRALLYGTLLFASVLGLGISLTGRSSLDVVILRGKEGLYQQVNDDKGNSVVVNHLRLHIRNQTSEGVSFLISAKTEDGKTLEVATAQNPVQMKPSEDQTLHIFVKFPPSVLDNKGEQRANLTFSSMAGGGFSIVKPLRLLGPSRNNE